MAAFESMVRNAWRQVRALRWYWKVALGAVALITLIAIVPAPTERAEQPPAVATALATAERNVAEAPTAQLPTPEATVEPAAATVRPTATRAIGFITRDDLGVRWPLTVESGTLGCQAYPRPPGLSVQPLAAFITIGGIRYGLNGMATASRGFADIEPLWSPNPAIPGTRINIGPLIDAALKLC